MNFVCDNVRYVFCRVPRTYAHEKQTQTRTYIAQKRSVVLRRKCAIKIDIYAMLLAGWLAVLCVSILL